MTSYLVAFGVAIIVFVCLGAALLHKERKKQKTVHYTCSHCDDHHCDCHKE